MSGERTRRLKAMGIKAGFGLGVFLVAFVFAFPYDRLKDVLVAQAAEANVDLEIGSLGPAFGLGLSAQDLTVRTRPVDGSKPIKIDIAAARATVSPLAALFGERAVHVSADALGGEFDVRWRAGKTRATTRIALREIAMVDLPGVKEAINLPLAGTLDLELDLEQPANKFAQASGTLTWLCAHCAIGDGKAKLKITGDPLLGEGLSFPRMRLGDFSGKVAIEKGVGRLAAVQAKSQDGELTIEGQITLADPQVVSFIDLYVRFKLTDAFLKSADKLKLLLQIAESGLRTDGFYGFRVSGGAGHMGPPRWSKTSPFAAAMAPSAPVRSGATADRARQAAAASAAAGAPSPAGNGEAVNPGAGAGPIPAEPVPAQEAPPPPSPPPPPPDQIVAIPPPPGSDAAPPPPPPPPAPPPAPAQPTGDDQPVPVPPPPPMPGMPLPPGTIE